MLGKACDYSESYKAKGPVTTYYADSNIEVSCYKPGLKTFYVTFYTKDAKAFDKINIFVEENAKSTSPPTPVFVPSGGGSGDGGNAPNQDYPKDYSATSSSSCANRDCKYDSSAKCQCDAVCVNYGDCCADKTSLCG